MRAGLVSSGYKHAYLPCLQASRAIAAFAVVCYHACLFVERKTGHKLMGGWYHLGELGVDFFFVLSGFIIAHVHGHELGRPECASRYVRRRFFRVYPLLFLLTTVKLAAELPRWLGGMQARDWDRLLSSYLLLPPPEGDMPIIAAAWTLQHEALFYALFLVALLLGRKAGVWLMAAWMVLVALEGVTGIELHGMVRLLCDAHNVEFICGVLACESLHHRIVMPARGMVWGIMMAALAGGVACYEARLGMDQPLLVRCALGAGFAALIWLLAGQEMRQGAMAWPAWLRWLGDASYSIYLAHSMVLMVAVGSLVRFIQDSTAIAYGVAGAAVMAGVAAGGLVWWLVERPLLTRSRSWCQ